MQAERDHLVRFVFPLLREELIAERIEFREVELRWGVTERADVHEVCREDIDACQPRFICMLGERYGWIPPGESLSITHQEIRHALTHHAEARAHHFFYFRDPDSTRTIPESASIDYREPHDAVAAQRLARLKEEVVAAGLRPRLYRAIWSDEYRRLTQLGEFGRLVYEDLRASIRAEFGPPESAPRTELEREQRLTEAFVDNRSSGYLVGGRAPLVAEVDDFLLRGRGTLCIVGDPGSGKSALLSWIHRTRRASLSASGVMLIAHFVGASPASTDVGLMVRHLCQELDALFPREDPDEPIPVGEEEVVQALHQRIRQVPPDRVLVLMIDAVNQLAPGSPTGVLGWLPREPRENVRIVLTTSSGDVLASLRAEIPSPRELLLPSFDETDVTALVDAFTQRSKKQLDSAQRKLLHAKGDAGRPLYLLTALEELRTLGTYEEITDRIRALPATIGELFEWILRRLEVEPVLRPTGSRAEPIPLTRRFFTLLASSRFGMEARELTELLDPGDPAGNVAALERLVRPHLLQRDLLLTFAHDELRTAVGRLYLSNPGDAPAANRELARYFFGQSNVGRGRWRGSSPRALAEVFFHLREGRQLAEAGRLGLDLDYLEAYCASVDVRAGIAAEPDHAGTYSLIKGLRDLRAAMEASGDAGLRDLRASLEPVARLLADRAGLLSHVPAALAQELRNAAWAGTAEGIPSPLIESARLRDDPSINLTRVIATGSGGASHGAPVTALALSPDGSLISGASDGSVGYWRQDRDRPRWLISTHRSWVTSVAVSPDGRQGVSASDDGTLHVWELELGTSRRLPPLGRWATPWCPIELAIFVDADSIFLLYHGGDAALFDLRTNSAARLGSELRHGELRRSFDRPWTAWVPQCRRLALRTPDKVVVFDVARRVILSEHPCEALHMALSADGETLLTSDPQGRTTLVDLASSTREQLTVDRLGGVCAWSDGFLYCTHRGQLGTIERQRNWVTRPRASFGAPFARLAPSILLCPSSDTLLTGHESGAITHFDLRDGRFSRRWEPDSHLIKGVILASGEAAVGVEGARRNDGMVISPHLRFIDAKGQTRVANPPHRDSITGVAALDAERVLTVDKAGTMVVWDDHRQPVDVQSRADHRFTACGPWTSKDGVRALVGTAEEEVLSLPQPDACWALPSTHDGLRAGIAAIAGVGHSPAMFCTYLNGMVRYRDDRGTWTAEQTARHSLRGTAAALAGPESLAASGNLNGEIQLWRCRDGSRLMARALHQGEVTALAFDPSGCWLASAGTDRLLYLVHASTGKVLHGVLLPRAPLALRFVDPCGLVVLVADGAILEYHLPHGADPATPSRASPANQPVPGGCPQGSERADGDAVDIQSSAVSELGGRAAQSAV